VKRYEPENLTDVWRTLRKPSPSGQPRVLPIGVDGMRTDIFERNLIHNIHEISRRIGRIADDGLTSYNFSALLCFEQPKNTGGFRKIYIPRIRDQVVLRTMHDDLVYAANIQGLRLCPPPPLSLVKAFRNALRQFSNPWILRTDIHSFFDSVPRAKVLDCTSTLNISETTRGLLTKWSATLRARLPGKLLTNQNSLLSGLPQGLSLSSSLAELWASKIDMSIKDRFHYFRYVDDIVVICETRLTAEAALSWLECKIIDLNLKLSFPKTQILPLYGGVPWLGLVHFPDKICVERERLERWLRRFAAIRRRAMENLRSHTDKSSRESVLQSFHREVRDEVSGRTSSRPAWYTISHESGEWKEMDRAIHAMIRSFHHQAGALPPSGRQLPSIHRALLARKSRLTFSVPSKAD